MSRDIIFKKEAFNKLLKGFDIAVNAIKSTLGPSGTNVFIEDGIYPKITNDGATVARYIELSDSTENGGAGIVRNASSQTNDDAGDGTTTTAVLLGSIVHESLKYSENPMKIRESIKKATPKILNSLKKQSVKIDKKDIKKVALISAEDENIAQLVTEIIEKIGEKSTITTEDSRTMETYYDIVEGYEANVGFISPAFITDQKKAKAIFEDVPVLITEKRISSVADIAPIFEKFKEAKINQCVIVCDDIDDTMLGVFINSKRIGVFNSVVIKATHPLLEDIEASVGAHRISESTGITFQNVTLDDLGKAKKVICDSKKTIFMGESKTAESYAKHLEKMVNQEKNQFIKQRLMERISKLRGGMAVLKIAASSDYEREYLKYKAEDTIKAVQAALEEGVVEGGGMALWRISNDIKPTTIGEKILKNALTSPLRTIIENCGEDYTDIILSLNGKGYDAKNNKVVDMIEKGIIDPHKVTRCALENAISAASTFITVGVTSTTHAENKD